MFKKRANRAAPPHNFFGSVGYSPVNTGPDVTPENARLVAVDPKAQAEFENILWRLRQKPLT